jgi:hypothetical protein
MAYKKCIACSAVYAQNSMNLSAPASQIEINPPSLLMICRLLPIDSSAARAIQGRNRDTSTSKAADEHKGSSTTLIPATQRSDRLSPPQVAEQEAALSCKSGDIGQGGSAWMSKR